MMRAGLLFFSASTGLAAAAGAVMNTQSDRIDLPPGVPPKIEMTDQPVEPAGKLVKVRYGPYVVPPDTMYQGLPPQFGGPEIPKPCDECYITAFQGGMEYEDGSYANIGTGAYLHHFVLVNMGKPDYLCGRKPGMGAVRRQWIYNNGNERPPVRLNGKYKFGMRVDRPDSFMALAEIMNAGNSTMTVYVTVIYEVVPLDTPGYREATHLRIDLWECGPSAVPAKEGWYQYHSPNWTSPYSGVILHNDGHGHPGTVTTKLYINGKVFCDSVQYYGLRPGTIQTQPMEMHGMHMDSMKVISDAVTCRDNGRIEKGDVLMTETTYNSSMYPQMMSHGRLESQMGINFLYIGRDEDTLGDEIPPDPNPPRPPVEMDARAYMDLFEQTANEYIDEILGPELTDMILSIISELKVTSPQLDNIMQELKKMLPQIQKVTDQVRRMLPRIGGVATERLKGMMPQMQKTLTDLLAKQVLPQQLQSSFPGLAGMLSQQIVQTVVDGLTKSVTSLTRPA